MTTVIFWIPYAMCLLVGFLIGLFFPIIQWILEKFSKKNEKKISYSGRDTLDFLIDSYVQSMSINELKENMRYALKMNPKMRFMLGLSEDTIAKMHRRLKP